MSGSRLSATPLLCAALLLSTALASPAPAGSFLAGATAERYSRAGPGNLWWAQAALPAGAFTGFARVEHLRRFGDLDTSVAAGLGWKGSGRGGALWAGRSPDADILARTWVEGTWDESLGTGLYAEAALKGAEYVPAHVYSGSGTLFWQARPWVELSGRAGAALTRFRNAGTKTYPGLLLRARTGPPSGRWWLTPAAGYYKEAFESGAPGATGAFAARVWALELGAQPAARVKAWLGFEYEDRTNGTFVRRLLLGIGASF